MPCQFQSNSLSQEQIWKNFEETGILDGWDGKKVDINDWKSDEIDHLQEVTVNWGKDAQGKPITSRYWINKSDEIGQNYRRLGGKNLVFRNCKNLKRLMLIVLV